MERNQINYDIWFKHADGSRISNAIIKRLKKNPALKVVTLKTPLHLRSGLPEDYVHEHIITFKDRLTPNKLNFVKNEIVAMIPELFPINYFFKFCSPLNFYHTLGCKFEFYLTGIDGNHFDVYTKIKEQKKNSAPIEAYQIKA